MNAEFGSKIYERKCAELEKLREESLAELEVRLWQIANEERDQAVKETFEQGQQELKVVQENAKKEKVSQCHHCEINNITITLLTIITTYVHRSP
jgi:transcription initiation factor IIE alpha subunit